jgi:hypothetical protein
MIRSCARPCRSDSPAGRYVFPPQVGAVLDEMCIRPSFRVHDLCRDKPAEFLLSFARYLHGIGFLRPPRARPFPYRAGESL